MFKSVISNGRQRELCINFDKFILSIWEIFRNKIIEKNSAGQGAGSVFPGQATGDPFFSVLSG